MPGRPRRVGSWLVRVVECFAEGVAALLVGAHPVGGSVDGDDDSLVEKAIEDRYLRYVQRDAFATMPMRPIRATRSARRCEPRAVPSTPAAALTPQPATNGTTNASNEKLVNARCTVYALTPWNFEQTAMLIVVCGTRMALADHNRNGTTSNAKIRLILLTHCVCGAETQPADRHAAARDARQRRRRLAARRSARRAAAHLAAGGRLKVRARRRCLASVGYFLMTYARRA